MNEKPSKWSPEGHPVPVAAAQTHYDWDFWPVVSDMVLIIIDTNGPELPAVVQAVDEPPEDEMFDNFGPVLKLCVFAFTGPEMLVGVRYGKERGFWHWPSKYED